MKTTITFTWEEMKNDIRDAVIRKLARMNLALVPRNEPPIFDTLTVEVAPIAEVRPAPPSIQPFKPTPPFMPSSFIPTTPKPRPLPYVSPALPKKKIIQAVIEALEFGDKSANEVRTYIKLRYPVLKTKHIPTILSFYAKSGEAPKGYTFVIIKKGSLSPHKTIYGLKRLPMQPYSPPAAQRIFHKGAGAQPVLHTLQHRANPAEAGKLKYGKVPQIITSFLNSSPKNAAYSAAELYRRIEGEAHHIPRGRINSCLLHLYKTKQIARIPANAKTGGRAGRLRFYYMRAIA